MKYLYGLLILLTVLVFWAYGDSPPVPGAETITFLDGSTGTVSYAEVTYSVAGSLEDGAPPAPTNLVLTASAEWELTFEWLPELGSTNIVVYPIKIQVPFEHDEGFIYIRARRVEL